MDKEYVAVAKFASIRDVSSSTVKRRIADGTIKKVKKVPGPFNQEKYMIHVSQLSMPQKELFGSKRPPVSKGSENNESRVLLNNAELMTEIRYLRKTNSIMDKRLEALELALSKQ